LWRESTVTRRNGVTFQSLSTQEKGQPDAFDCSMQYTSREFADFCAENGVVRSMGRRATCFDNAVAESFFATYKKELIHTRPWDDLAEVRQHTFLWIEGYYNRRRRHSTLDYLTPDEYELGFRKLTDLAA
jgi:putative transposase